MKKIIKFLIPVLVFIILVLPVVSFAAFKAGDPIVPCDTNCGWPDLLKLVNNVITFTLYFLAVPIAAIMFAYAGFLLVTAQGGEAKTKAKNIFTNAVLGIVLAAACWLIVKAVLYILGYEGGWIGF